MQPLSGQWGFPTKIHCGSKTIENLVTFCQDLNIKRPLLVTDKGLSEHDVVKLTANILNAAKIDATLFCDIEENPKAANIKRGVEIYNQKKHDGVIAIGGGSALDAGKAIALMQNQTKPLTHFIDEGTRYKDANTPLCPIIAIPTTAGTGSEVGRCAVIVDEDTKKKLILFHPEMLPKLVILDPELTISLPTHLTAFTGMDALSHNLEAYCVNNFHPIADAIAVEGIHLIHKSLLNAYEYPDDIVARTQMLVASSMGATAFQKGLGAMHAISHSIGGLYGSHHGMLNAILMPYVLQFNRVAIEDKIIHLAKTLGLSKPNFEGFIDWVIELRGKMNVPNRLDDLDIEFDEQAVIKHALIDPSAGGNPVPLVKLGLESIFSNARIGAL